MMKHNINIGNDVLKNTGKEPVHQEQEDPRINKALNVKNVMQTIMRMNKEDLKKTLAEKKDTMEELARSQPMEVKTIDNMWLSLLAIEVYERELTLTFHDVPQFIIPNSLVHTHNFCFTIQRTWTFIYR